MKKRDRAARAQDMIKLFSRAPIKKTFGMELTYDGELRAHFHLPYNPQLDHALNDTHAGIIATLIDNAGWFTAAVQYDTWITTVEFHIRLLEPPRQAALHAHGTLVRVGKRMTVTEMRVEASDGHLIAIGSGTFVVTSTSTDE